MSVHTHTGGGAGPLLPSAPPGGPTFPGFLFHCLLSDVSELGAGAPGSPRRESGGCVCPMGVCLQAVSRLLMKHSTSRTLPRPCHCLACFPRSCFPRGWLSHAFLLGPNAPDVMAMPQRALS